MAQSYYDILGVSETASPDEIKKAYRKQALRWHPDKNGGSKESEERFKHIAAAYATLSNPAERSQYDRLRREATGSASEAEPSFDAATAEEMFFREMVGLAVELTMKNVPWSRIATALVEKGCPSSVAAQIARGVEAQRKATARIAAGKAFAWACGWIVLGIIITGVTYSLAENGGHYVVTSGLFLFGAINIIRALFYLVSGRVPQT